jgi:serine/threonine protein kinase
VEPNANTDEPLLLNCPDCGTAMDVSEVEPLSAVACPSCGAPTTVSTNIDHFQLVDVIGHGGMGAVYKAYDTSLDRHVALKLLRKSSGSPEQIAQLATEASITASINHPHVVRVFSTGTDHGRFYIAMELVEKGTLDSLIELQGRVAEAQVLEVGVQIASGLRAAQHAGLIHRDVKPGNILFATAHTAKIVDFGLAIFAEDEAKVRGEIWGTPYYVAPEKLDHKPEDFRSDIYSLGGTLFHALAGRPPFEAENASLVALKHLKNQAVSLQAFAPHVSSNTAYVINRTLNKDPAQRYQSYNELIEHLEYALTELQAGRGKAETKRVVLETDESKKAMGLITFGLIGALLLLGITIFFLRDRIFSNRDDTATSAEETTGKNVVMFPFAFEKLADGRPTEASELLAKAIAQKPAQPMLNWAGLFHGLAELAAGKRPEAMAIFRKIEEREPFSKKPADKPLATFFTETARQMAIEGAITPGSVPPGNPANYESLPLLFYGVKNWEAGEYKDAAELLRRFRQASPEGTYTWIANLKPLATRYAEEFTAFQMASDRLKTAKTFEEKRAAVVALKAIQGKLAPKAQEMATPLSAEVARIDKERNDLLAQGRLPEGRYRILNRKNNKALEVEGHSRDDGHRVQQNSYSAQANQQWNISALGDGYYLLAGLESGKALNVPSGQLGDNTALQQAGITKGPTQKWKIERVETGIWKLTAEISNKALTAVGDADRGDIVQKGYTGAPEQQWKIESP